MNSSLPPHYVIAAGARIYLGAFPARYVRRCYGRSNLFFTDLTRSAVVSGAELSAYLWHPSPNLWNLVDNAIRYTPEGGRVDLSVGVSQGKAELCIQDSGPGIPLAERERVFDPFYRTLGSEQIGSGLGLSILQTIAHRIGAEIRLGFVNEIQQTGLKVVIIVPMR